MNQAVVKTTAALCVAVVAMLCCAPADAQRRPNEEVSYMETSTRYLEPTQNMMALPLVAEIEVSPERYSYTEKEAFNDYPVTESILPMIPNFKQIALCRAARQAAKDRNSVVDMIVAATIEINTNFMGRLEITVEGYPARYVKFRSASREDLNLVREGNLVMVRSNDAVLGKPDTQLKINEVTTNTVR